jgi:hypothetical protein
MQNRPRHTLYIDFDRTLADTFTPGPSRIGVTEASANAVRQLFGEAGYQIYEERLGGLQNREPRELIEALHAEGVSNPALSSIKEAAQAYVDAKLAPLLQDISPEWPALFPGVKDFFQTVASGELAVTPVIVSSGHDAFINKVFQEHGLPLPAMVTSDTVRDRVFPDRPKFKPWTYQLAVAHQEELIAMRGQRGVIYETPSTFTKRGINKQFMMYIGDDPNKDGGLARNARILYGFVPFVKPEYTPKEAEGQVLIPDFGTLTDILRRNNEALIQGQAMTEIFLGKQDSEVFPPTPEGDRPWQKWMKEQARRPLHERSAF